MHSIQMITQSCGFLFLLFLFCVVRCPVGTFHSGSDCELCPVASYQNQEGQTSCKECPNGDSTKSRGSFSMEQCESIFGYQKFIVMHVD